MVNRTRTARDEAGGLVTASARPSRIWWLALLLGLVLCPPVPAQVETADDLAFLEELELAFRKGGSWSAQRDLSEYLADFPGSSRARRLAARVAFRRGRLEETDEHLRAGGEPDPWLRSRWLLRRGDAEGLQALAAGTAFPRLTRARLEVEALDLLGQRRAALTVARNACGDLSTAGLDGDQLKQMGWLLLHQRRFELANQALVFADRELNGPQGRDYQVNDAEVLHLLGRTFAETRQAGGSGGDRTLTILNDALEVDPGDPAALTIKARAYSYGGNGRKARQALRTALDTDPGHPEALVVEGELLLEARQPDPALERAERVLAVNPRHRGGLALRAAALALTIRHDEAGLAEQDFRQAHPESGAYDLLLGRVLQSHYRFAESIAPLEAAMVREPEVEAPLPVLAMSLANVGREDEARVALEEHLARSPFPFPWRHNMLTVLEQLAEADSLRTESGFHLRLPAGERGVYGRLLSERLDEARADMAERWGVEPDGEVLVEVFDVHGDFSVRTVGFEGFGALGACFGNVVTILSPLCELRGQFHWEQTAVHEYAHVVTLTLSRSRMPRWLSEGVSVLEEKTVDPLWARALERDVLDARANGMILPVARMEENFQDASTVMLGYYVGSLVCEVVQRDFGFDGLVALVAAYAEDLTTAQAVQAALGISAEELDRRLLAYIDNDLAGRAALAPRYNERGKEALRERVLAGDQEALVPLARAYHDLGQTVDRDAALQRALDELGPLPALRRLQARRALQAGDRVTAVEHLEAWEAAGELDHDGLVLMAQLALDWGERERALDLLRRARELFPGDVGPQSANALLFQLLDPEDDRPEWLAVVTTLADRSEAALQPRRILVEEALDQGDRQELLRRQREIVSIEPYAAGPRLQLAEWLVEEGLEDQARTQWELVLALRADQVPEGEDLDGAQQTARRRLDETGDGATG